MKKELAFIGKISTGIFGIDLVIVSTGKRGKVYVEVHSTKEVPFMGLEFGDREQILDHTISINGKLWDGLVHNPGSKISLKGRSLFVANTVIDL